MARKIGTTLTVVPAQPSPRLTPSSLTLRLARVSSNSSPHIGLCISILVCLISILGNVRKRGSGSGIVGVLIEIPFKFYYIVKVRRDVDMDLIVSYLTFVLLHRIILLLVLR